MKKMVTLLLIFFLAHCAHEQPNITKNKQRATANREMVVTAHALATKASLAILQQGGNSIDAAVAASFVLSVVRPQSTGIGGGGFLLFYSSNTKEYKAYDFRERAPLLATKDMFVDAQGEPKDFTYKGKIIPQASLNGPLSIGTPGLVAGLLHVHNKHGLLELTKIMKPAITIAEKGFEVYATLAQAIEKRKTIIAHFSATKKIFFKEGLPLKKGELLVQKDLANTLRLIAKYGTKGFYQGEVAQKIVRTVSKGGILSQSDLDSYRVNSRKPVVGSYKGYRIVSMPPPSSGGIHLIQILNILENTSLASYGHHTAQSIHITTEAMKLAFRDRAIYLGDPDFVDIPVAKLISKKYARTLYDKIQRQQVLDLPMNTTFIPKESPSTTHLSIVDRFGNAVSSTQTINYSFGSCVVAEGTGVVLNNEMDDFSIRPGIPNAYGLIGSKANAIAAKKTMLSSMSPSFVLDKNGNLMLIIGSPGGAYIITATLQTILNVFEFNMKLDQAVASSRFHHQWMPNKLAVETGGFPKSVLLDLNKIGHQVTITKNMGDIQAIGKSNKGFWVGVSDWRDVGLPLGR